MQPVSSRRRRHHRFVALVPSLALSACSSCPPPVDAPKPPPPAQADPGRDVSPGGHDHAQSSFTDAEIINGSQTVPAITDDNQVDMMLFVVGLNHQFPNDKLYVGAEGVSEVATAMFSAWLHRDMADRIVVVGTGMTSECKPTSGACLRDELARRYGAPFVVSQHQENGVITGARWAPSRVSYVSAASKPTETIARVALRDSVSKLAVEVFAVHSGDALEVVDETQALIPIARPGAKGQLTPIFAGDFNFTEDVNLNHPENVVATQWMTWLTHTFQWVNHDVPRGGMVFPMQNGNQEHAFVGKLADTDPAYGFQCAAASLRRVRLSFSVDANGNLAVRPGDKRSAINHGLILPHIAHNVLAFGLRITPRVDTAPAGRCGRALSAGAACGGEDVCGTPCKCGAGLKCVANRCSRRPPETSEECNARCDAELEECDELCAGTTNPNCTKQCASKSQSCHGGC